MSKAKETFSNTLGEAAWDQSWDTLSKLDPEIFEASVKLMAVPKQKKHLSTKMQSLVQLSVDCAATHLYVPGIRLHVKNAAAAGATLAEVMEVLELSSTLGIHACNIGVPLLVQVMKEEGFFWDDFLALDPEFFAAYTDFSSAPWTKRIEGVDGHAGALSNQDKELIYCAFDSAATHLYVSGLKEHMRNALRYGATVEQVVEVLELATPLSLHTLNVTAPIVQEIYGQR
ncbi:hypothetical protein B0A55_11153 [Friedmanniomyces simplex]|uniref:Carboxymuconolactone decarboxylase-like domain-containing protein n=1 Tax=Friedmanniomyces simplex TaxID=329884 RepID=A0A4U0W2C5_9PEZI|nr:hypothetical protein B0A55_11153 [Friedmanniomyces simplex]